MASRLCMAGVRKRFGATQALRGVSFSVNPGEVHALVGENGAGKSTLMKILSGACRPDEGEMQLDGRTFAPSDPLHARRAGIAMIYQELNLAPHLSVEENMLLGDEPAAFGWIHRDRRRTLARQALSELQHESIPLDLPVNRLTLAEQQVVEIARALIRDARVVIMDEPTSSLTRVDTENLFRVIARLRARGVSVVYISHFLEECQRICDRFTVLRDGESVGHGAMGTVDLREIIRLMVGREITEIYPGRSRALGPAILEIRALKGERKPCSASLILHQGEILGIAGLIGAGRTETLRACFGLDAVISGRIELRQQERTRATPAERLADGLGLLSENRKDEGLMLNRSLSDNLMATRYSPLCRFGLISPRREREAAGRWIERLGVKSRDPNQRIHELSGGNQQKIALGRLLHHEAAILLLDEPTRGIDVGSKASIYRLMGELAGQGKAVIFVSSYLPELLGVCDSIAVMCRGVLGPSRPAESWTEHSIIQAAMGQSNEGSN